MPADVKVEARIQIAAKYLDMMQWSEAETVCHALLDDHPAQPDALYVLALAELALSRPQEAQAHLAASIEAEPRPEPLSDLGKLLKEDGRFDEAIDCFHRALELRPGYAIALNNLGDALQMKGRPDEALAVLEQAVAHAPDLPEIHNNLGVVLRDMEQLDAAEKSFNQAIRLRPEFAEAWSNLGNVAAVRGDTQRARMHYEKSLAIGPNDALRLRMATLMPGIPSSREEVQTARDRFRNDIRQLTEDDIRIADPLKDVGTTPFYLAYQGQDDRADLEMLAALYRQACPSLSFVAPHCTSPYRGAEGRRIKIGFQSPYFYYHTIGRLMEGLIRLLPRDRFEVHLFASNPKSDDMAKSFETHADHHCWVPRS
ncbi:MAG: tetratricopeptide repeat protein, partial [Proteobacteria bacterium]|nr:tetratricopeptide repeat protein [Pseudomonadota bacterium]